MSENLLIAHCSPTLAGLKTGNLFNCAYPCRKQLMRAIRRWNRMLNPKGVFIHLMRAENGRALIYVYRKEKLSRELHNAEVRSFLEAFGYDCRDLEGMIRRLAARIQERGDFPHEIGVFLGYPFADVKGFIENKGKNCKHAGHWKVYSDASSAEQIFMKYEKCTDVYRRRLEEGADILRLTVAGRYLLEG